MYLINILLVKSIVLVVTHIIVNVHGGNVGNYTYMNNLDTNENSVVALASDICFDLEFYHINSNKSTPFSAEDCHINFINSTKYQDKKPPNIEARCTYPSKIIYGIEPIDDPGVRRLTVLTKIHPAAIEGDYLPYDLLENNNKQLSKVDISSGEYQTWTTLISFDGNHSPWLRGPVVRSWNQTGDVMSRNYSIKVTQKHQVVNGTSAVSALVSWEPLDAEDGCFDFVNFCSGKTEFKIWPNESTSMEVSGLPMGEKCQVRLIGKYGVTHFSYHTPDCVNMKDCIDYERAHNLSVKADPAEHGWDVSVNWTYFHQPLAFNVTLVAKHVKRSIKVPGNVTSVVFEEIEDSGLYLVVIASVLEKRRVYTSSRAQFPIKVPSGVNLGPALGGTWGALVGLGVVAAVILLLWRRRQVNRMQHIYFPEPFEKPRKEAGKAGDAKAAASQDVWELSSDSLLLHEVIGEGAFGVVRRGTLASLGKEVAVKMLKDFPSLDEIRSFRTEIKVMKSVGAHPHVVSLVGCSSGRKPYIVAEYCSRGDLLSYLRCCWDFMVTKRNTKYFNNNIDGYDYRKDLFKFPLQGEDSKLVANNLYELQGACGTELTTRDLLSFCRQIAMGMEFLAANRLVHRDLAARNVLVTSDRTLKIADFGLSRDVYEENLYKQKGNGKLPMKWMAPESLTRRIYTTQSDVWSFGVVMWEVVSVGASPYAGVPTARLPRLLRAGYRMPRPVNCSQPLYEEILSCWRQNARERPTFVQLHARLDELLDTASAEDYLTFEPDPDDVPRLSAHKYVKMYLKQKLGWSSGDEYERPIRTAQSNHYSTPPASACKLTVS
ncbi:tyrosine-protein kinase receptor torso-like isoform X2 [Ostrinia furnacalis]|uniref:tyrosine-protein kinase receptor torso-like isoform X1 n=1 Tax=Ostrinia furnacalis TaxID=93504 RepID=UPI001038F938|nr:tyrosine-protein kinase receptor torso-like isoform X1 [Ostrinia furnacalis]XP_028172882.1 tyrosine-protein kinase receptor torso-like isoform X2 [Ostrinia furnacalis]